MTLADESETLVTIGAEYGLSRYRSVTVVAGNGELMPIGGRIRLSRLPRLDRAEHGAEIMAFPTPREEH